MTDLIWDGERAPFAKAFVAAQRATEAIKKASTNPAFKSRYADLAAVVEAVVPALNAAGIGVIQSSDFDGDLVTVTTVLLHESGSSVTSSLRLRPSKQDPQGVGSATTYGRRYSLLAMTGAAPEDDDCNAASGPREPRPQQEAPKPPTLAERADRFTTSLKALTTTAEREKAYKLASKLLADLDASDPERLAEIEALYLELQFDGERAAA
jgi:hypothetical protein